MTNFIAISSGISIEVKICHSPFTKSVALIQYCTACDYTVPNYTELSRWSLVLVLICINFSNDVSIWCCLEDKNLVWDRIYDQGTGLKPKYLVRIKYYIFRVTYFIIVSLMCCDTYRIRARYVIVHHEAEESTCKPYWARLWACGWAPLTGDAESQTVCQGSQWWQNGVWTKRRLAGSADFRKPVRHVSDSLTANWSTTCRQLYHTEWRLKTQIWSLSLPVK